MQSLENEDGGLARSHAPLARFPILAAPTTSKGKNTIRLPLYPIACWRLNDVRFDINLSFLRPAARKELCWLKAIVRKHPGAPLCIFGHTDPLGKKQDNKILSGRRARSVYGLLTRKVSHWEDIYENPIWGDDWNIAVLQTILETLGYPPGEIDGQIGPQTRAAIASFQRDHAITSTGTADKQTRGALFLAYMDFLCGEDFRLAPSDFLGRGADPGGRGDYHGCSEFNPIVRLSVAQEIDLGRDELKAERAMLNAPNRRVVVFLFPPGEQMHGRKWPCPASNEGIGNCQKRFWSDAQERREAAFLPRKFEETFDTMECRFYHRMAIDSPCESGKSAATAWVRIVVRDAETQKPVSGAVIELHQAKSQTFRAETNAAGVALFMQLEHSPVVVHSGQSPDEGKSFLAFVKSPSLNNDAVGATHRIIPPRRTDPPAGPLHIRVILPDDAEEPSGFVDVKSPAPPIAEIVNNRTRALNLANLDVNREHEIFVTPVEPFPIYLRAAEDFAIPLAEYEFTAADHAVHEGRFSLQGAAAIWNPPEGPFEISYPDQLDIKAKSLAGRARKACATDDVKEMCRVLLYSQELLKQASNAYDKYFNDLSGKGMAHDMQDAVAHDDSRIMLRAMIHRAGLEVRNPDIEREAAGAHSA